MRAVLLVCLVILSAIASADADPSAVTATIHGTIANVPIPVLRQYTARVAVNGGQHVALTSSQGRFTLPPLPPGSHTLDVDLDKFIFPQVRVDVSRKGPNRYRAVLNDGSGTVLVNAMSGASNRRASNDDEDDDATGSEEIAEVPISAIGQHQYFAPREEFSIMAILKQPMILMMVVSLGLVYLMPKLVDPDEMKAQMKEMQSAGTQLQQAAQGGKPKAQ